MTEELKNLTINAEKIPISWEKQRSDINAQIAAETEPKRRFVLIHRWADIAALIFICILGGWFLTNHELAPKEEVAFLEEDITINETLPASLVVFNDFDPLETDYEEFIDFMVP